MRNFDTQGLPKTILQLNINIEDVIAYFGQRKEFEIIYLHESVYLPNWLSDSFFSGDYCLL